VQAHKLHLAHGDATDDLAAIIAKADLHDQCLDLAEAPLLAHARGIGGHLPEHFDIGCEPGQTVSRMLGVVEGRAVERARRRERLAKTGDGPGEKPLAGPGCICGEFCQSIENYGLLCLDRLSCRHEMLLSCPVARAGRKDVARLPLESRSKHNRRSLSRVWIGPIKSIAA
jgi:hypothetical protein